MNGSLLYRAMRATALSCMLLWPYALRSQQLLAHDVEPRISVRISCDHHRFYAGEDIRLHVEIWNVGDQDLFFLKDISTVSNALAKLDLTWYQGNKPVGPWVAITSDSFSSERSTYPPLVGELPRYWIAIPPKHFYGAEVVLEASSFGRLKALGRYRIQGVYSSRGFLAQDINNPLFHYAEELKQLPYEAWVGQAETNSLWIEITNKKR